jgi:ElaB/YqjD/DUF883 family membrane-anchored ribosome-binding protein
MTSSASLQRDAAATRSGLSRTLEELRGTMTTTAISAGATALAKESGAAMARAAVGRATAQPFAALLIGAGLFMLLKPRAADGDGTWMTHAREFMQGHSYRPSQPASPSASSAGRAKVALHDAQDRVSDAVAQGRDALAAGQERVQEKVQTMVEQGRQQAGETLDAMRERTARTRDTLSHFVQEQPILAAACAVAVGAAIGAAFPMTELERGYLGEAGAKLNRKGRQVASDVADTVGDQLVGQDADSKVEKVVEAATASIRD